MIQETKKAIIEEFLTKPSQVAPTLFVGLGGAGCKMIARVHKQLKMRADYEERFKDLCRFAFLDTNIHDLEKYREAADDLFLVSDFEKAEYSKLAGGKAYLDADDYFTQWVPQTYRFRSGDTAGAGQIRIESRLGMYYQVKHKDVVQRFRKLIEHIKDHSHGHRRLDSAEIRIVVAYSIAGGTGSGTHLPVAYLLREIAEQYGKPLVFGVAALSSVFEEKVGTNKDGVFANGYAALKETEYLMKLGAPDSRFFPDDASRVFHYNPSDRTRRTVTSKPFEVLWIVDRPESFSVSDPLLAAGDALYLQLFTPIYGEQAGDFDNYTQHQRFLVPHDFEAKGIPGYTSFYGAFGAAVLHVPDRSLLDYCSRRGALAVIESSFLQGLPSGEVYKSIDLDAFSMVKREERGREVREVEFDKRSETERNVLRNKLFQKRVRMLAHAEMEADTDVDFFARVFRHGHGDRALPDALGSLKSVSRKPGATPSKHEASLDKFREALAKEQLGVSMGHFVINALEQLPENPLSSRLLLQAKQRTQESIRRQFLQYRSQRENQKEEQGWFAEAVGKEERSKTTSRGEMLAAAERIEKEQKARVDEHLLLADELSPKGTDWVPGFAWLHRLGFLTAPQAAKRNLIEKRYAVLTVMDEVDAILKEHREILDKRKTSKAAAKEAPTGSPNQGADSDPKEALDFPQLMAESTTLEGQAIKRVEAELLQRFIDHLETFQKSLHAYSTVFTELQSQYVPFRKRQIDSAESLRKSGTKDETDRFLLDGEALQIEGGRRMWDFYFDDQIKTLGKLQISSNEALAGLLAGQVQQLVDGTGRGEEVPGDALDTLYGSVSKEIETVLKHKVLGDIRSASEGDRFGLSLEEALKLEILYRAIYLTNRERVDRGTHDDVAAVVSASQIAKTTVDHADPVHTDYLRDKVKRLIKERSDLLCYLDEKHLSQGGVRPDEIFLAALHEDLYKGLLKDILGVSLGMRPPRVITAGVDDRKSVIFYRAIMNVPLYVFGRMRDLRACYYQFKDLAKRSKVLHIDKNWEDSLPDLDPAVVEEEHRQQRIRDSVLDFATLLRLSLRQVDDAIAPSPEDEAVGDDGRDLPGQGSFEERYGIGESETCITWRELPGSSNDRVWVLRMPLAERKKLIDRDGVTKDEVDRMEPVIGSTIGESVLKVQEFIADSPRLYESLRTVCAWIREGKSPMMIQQLVRLPGAWRKHRESLRSRYGRAPREDQIRQLADLKNVSDKLADALIKLHEDLDLRQREERGLLSASLESGLLSEDEARMAEAIKDSIGVLQSFKVSEQEQGVPQKTGLGTLFQPLGKGDKNPQRTRSRGPDRP